jgi:hypothetical protein
MSALQSEKEGPAAQDDDLGRGKMPLCREPWESYYILRRGILPCCHGNPIIAPITDWASAWNSPQVQEIRRYLSQGRLSPYCLESRGCPIVQRILYEQETKGGTNVLPRRPWLLRALNRLMFRIPGRLVRAYREKKHRP